MAATDGVRFTRAQLSTSDRTAVRLAADSRQTDGYYDNTFLNREDTNGTDEQSLIVKVRHETPSGTLSWVTRRCGL